MASRAPQLHDGKVVLYGCGDPLYDYEGIGGYEVFRGELGPMYFPTLDTATGRLVRLQLVPTSLRRLRIKRATADDAHWLCDMLTREGRKFGTAAELLADDRLELRWAASA